MPSKASHAHGSSCLSSTVSAAESLRASIFPTYPILCIYRANRAAAKTAHRVQ